MAEIRNKEEYHKYQQAVADFTERRAITVTFERNDSHPKGKGSITLGPFEWVQFTYGLLRDDKDNELAGRDDAGYWETEGDSWSDIIISTAKEG